MTTVVIMPGGFHPFHAGHLALYNSARRTFPDAEVYVAATNDTSARPFPFSVKEKLAKLAGVEPGHFVQVKSPFRAEEITSRFDPNKDQLIFVRSEKDANKPPQAGGVKKDGSPAYLQPLLGAKKIEPFAQHAYMAYLPTVEFGPGMTSATEIRTAWPELDERRKLALVMSLYPRTQGNRKLAATVVRMLDTAIGSLNEFAPPGGSDGNDGFSDDTLKRLAAQWWNNDEDPRVEQTLAAAGWEIGRDEGYDNGGAFVVRAGDENGNSYMSWPAQELENLREGSSCGPRRNYALRTYVVNVMDEATGKHQAIEIRATHPDMAKERAHMQGYKVLGIKEKGMAEGAQNSFKIRCAGKTVKTDTYKKAQEQARQMADASGKDAYISGFRDSASTEEIVKPTKQGVAEVAPPKWAYGMGGIRPPAGGATRPGPGIRPPASGTAPSAASQTARPADNDFVAPHGDAKQEFEMFQAGTKPAVIVRGSMINDYQPMLKTGRYPVKQFTSRGEVNYVIGQPGADDRVEKIYQLVSTASKMGEQGNFNAYNNSNYHRWLGTLLGYPKQKVEAFIANYFRNKTDLAQQRVDVKEVTRGYIQEEPDYIEEKWSEKYKRSINCANPRGFSQRAHCAGRKK